jgi:hypothetical protein
MQKKIAAVLFSTRLTATLFLVFAVAMAVGTFLDVGYQNAPSAYTTALIYNAWWFEAIMLLFVINFVGNIFRYRLHKKEKWTTLLLHLSFILILVGAFVTRYIGFEGVIHIREGATENTILSQNTYFTVFIDGDYQVDGAAQRRTVTPKKLILSDRLNNDFEISTDYNEQPVTFTYKGFIKGAKEGLIPTDDGEDYLKIVEAGDGERHDHWMKLGEVVNIHNILFSVNKPTPGAININYSEESGYTIESPFEGTFMRMADQMKGTVVSDSLQPLMLRSLYQLAGMSFVLPDPIIKGTYGLVKATKDEKSNQDGLIVDVSTNGETKTVELLGGKGTFPDPKSLDIGGLKVYLSYGSKQYELPFSITLNDFIAEKYPGTEKGYSAFKSNVTVNDPKDGLKDEEIFMNNVLDKGGYRFFQSGFDPDEKGTILSVNHDFWGTWITYIGYFLLYLGLMLILFDKGSRFGQLEKMLNSIKKRKKKGLTVLILLFSLAGYSQETEKHGHTEMVEIEVDSMILANAVSKEHAAKFGELIIQDNGRMKPINTFASELLRKVSRSNEYAGLDANQVFI